MSDIIKLIGEKEDKQPATHCYCNECGTTHKIEECDLEADSEGWEYETYYYHRCPTCMKKGSEGDITDYFTEVGNIK